MNYLAYSLNDHRTRPLALGMGACVLVFSTFAMSAEVPTVAVQSRQVGASYSLDGVIQAVKQSTIAAQASGRIATLQVKAGDKVRAGQILATIDDRDASAASQRSQAQISQADAEMGNAKAQLERTKDLQSKGFVSKAALDTALSQFNVTSAAREQALAGAKQTAVAQGFTRVTAPFDGWVLQTFAEAGDLALPGKPLVTVYAPQPLRAVVQVPTSRTQAVRAATQTLVQVGQASDGASGIVPVAKSSVPSADPVSQTTEWRFELANKDALTLLPGQQVQVQFSQAQGGSPAKLMLPAQAILRRGELSAVYVVTGNVFSLRAVRVGVNQGREGVEVLAGLNAGDVVALDPVRAGFANATPAKPGK
jgi:RND family efflux transporter MFP subunit